jgi:hypothetical protein
MANTSLPLQLPWDKSSTLWATQINPVLGCELVNGLLLRNVALVAGLNTVNHKLGRKLIGWFPTRIQGTSATFYDEQNSNQMPALTLALVASTAVTIDLWVF